MAKKIGLALSGGAIKGIAEIPIIQKLIENDVKIDCVAGASIGAIIGAYYCMYEEVDSFYEMIISLKPKDWVSLMDISYPLRASLIKGKSLKKHLKAMFGDKKFKDLKIPLIVSVTNFNTGRTEYITKGNLVDALMASAAYPGIFPPYGLNGNHYIDGGLLDNLPYQKLLSKKMDKVIAINVNNLNLKKKDHPKTITEVMFRLTEIIRENTYTPHVDTNKKIFAFQPKLKDGMLSMWSIKDVEDKYQSGVKEFKKKEKEFLDWIK